MEDIKVGEYIRTKNGIRRFVRITDNGLYQIDEKVPFETGNVTVWALSLTEKEILKHSFNIIDLIKIGDYVNCRLIEEISSEDGRKYVGENCGDSYYDCVYFNEDIKSVVTKEQFENMKYIVGGKEE